MPYFFSSFLLVKIILVINVFFLFLFFLSKQKDTVKIISELLECDNAKLDEAFVHRSIIVRGEMSKIPLTAAAVNYFFIYFTSLLPFPLT